MVGTQIVLMVAVLGFLAGRPDFLDIALVYVLISFVSTLAVLKFCRRHHEPPDCHCKVGDED
jgi:multicomponent Na+:H+ antiporter subunit F